MTKIDKIFKKPIKNNEKFKFDEKTVEVFENMINRSVPNYKFIIAMTGIISKNFIKNNSTYYDLGCSTGATTYSVMQNNKNKKFDVKAIDNSLPMIEKAKPYFKNHKNIEFLTEDICSIDFDKNISFVSMNYILQFIEPNKRTDLLTKIYNSMQRNAGLILSEKICFEDKEEDVFMENLQGMFKQQNGYSKLEIAQKRTALENVLIRQSFQEYEKILKNIGFTKIYKWFQSFNFISVCAVK